MTPADNQAALVDGLSVVPDPLERLNSLVGRARSLPEVPERERLEPFLVRGCQAPLWVVPERDVGPGLWTFRSYSASPVVAALAHLIASVYSGCRGSDIAAFETTVLADLGLDRHLTPNRRQGAANISAKIRGYIVPE